MDSGRPEFEQLFDTTHRALLAYARRRSVTDADAEDAVAETYAIAWRRLAAIPADEMALPWLYGVARRVLANHRRTMARRSRLAQLLRQNARAERTDAPWTINVPALEALAALSADDQELLRLVAWEDLSHGQIAAVLGISTNAVGIRLHRARARFVAVLARMRLVETRSAPVNEELVKGFRIDRTSIVVKGHVDIAKDTELP